MVGRECKWWHQKEGVFGSSRPAYSWGLARGPCEGAEKQWWSCCKASFQECYASHVMFTRVIVSIISTQEERKQTCWSHSELRSLSPLTGLTQQELFMYSGYESPLLGPFTPCTGQIHALERHCGFTTCLSQVLTVLWRTCASPLCLSCSHSKRGMMIPSPPDWTVV